MGEQPRPERRADDEFVTQEQNDQLADDERLRRDGDEPGREGRGLESGVRGREFGVRGVV